MYEILTVIISVAGSAVTSFLVAKYYGERWVETRRCRMEHSTKLKDGFFKRWLEKIGENKDQYCEIGARYSKKTGRMVPLKPQEPKDLEFYDEAMSHLKDYDKLRKDWKNLKQITLKLNEELATLFEEIRVLVIKEIDVPYWCPRYIGEYSGDKPDEYLCPDSFVRSIYDEVYWRIRTSRRQYLGNGNITPTIVGEGKKIYFLNHGGSCELASSQSEELMQKTQRLFSRFINDEQYKRRIKTFADKQEDTYSKELEIVKLNISNLIKSIELGSIIKGKCGYCQKF